MTEVNSLVSKEDTNEIVRQEVTPNIMLQIAVEQGADIDKLEKLMNLQERWEEREAKKAFVEALSLFRGRCPCIEKQKNHTILVMPDLLNHLRLSSH